MKFRRLTFILIFISITACLWSSGITPLAEKGVINLRHLENSAKFVLQLNGEWEFYWNKMLHPHDFVEAGRFRPDCFGKVPSYWTDYSSEQVKTTGMGFATYRLTVLLPEGFREPYGF